MIFCCFQDIDSVASAENDSLGVCEFAKTKTIASQTKFTSCSYLAIELGFSCLDCMRLCLE